MKPTCFGCLFCLGSYHLRRLFRVPSFLIATVVIAQAALGAPKTIIISLDGATTRLVDQFSESGAVPPGVGLRLLEEKGVMALQNFDRANVALTKGNLGHNVP
jgi:hypothetical protein